MLPFAGRGDLPTLDAMPPIPSLAAPSLQTPVHGTGILEAFDSRAPMAQLHPRLLVFFSLVSWAIILCKCVHFRRAAAQSRKFLEIFRNSKRFSEVNAATARLAASPLVGLFQAGYVEIDAQVRAQGEEAAAAGALPHPLARRRRAHAPPRGGVEPQLLTRGSAFLATTAAAAPFIGLFGTVWGIMQAFDDIGRTGSTSIVAVAPGIAEALINTAAGLAAAIPALVAYNYLGGRVRACARRWKTSCSSS